MMISMSAALDMTAPVQDFDISLTVMDSSDALDTLRSATVGWGVPLTLNKQEWQDFLFHASRGQSSFYICVLGFYVRHLGYPE